MARPIVLRHVETTLLFVALAAEALLAGHPKRKSVGAGKRWPTSLTLGDERLSLTTVFAPFVLTVRETALALRSSRADDVREQPRPRDADGVDKKHAIGRRNKGKI
jgi:hypothetical protein